MARRLATTPELFAVAAEQYLPMTGALHDAGERRQVVGLLRRAAEQAARGLRAALGGGQPGGHSGDMRAGAGGALLLSRAAFSRSRCLPVAMIRPSAVTFWALYP